MHYFIHELIAPQTEQRHFSCFYEGAFCVRSAIKSLGYEKFNNLLCYNKHLLPRIETIERVYFCKNKKKKKEKKKTRSMVP
jgi:hypothetical protein